MRGSPPVRQGRSKGCRSESRTSTARPACRRPPRAASCKGSCRPTSRRCPPIYGGTAPSCSASSISTSSPWARRTRRRSSGRSCRPGVDAARTPNSYRAVRPAARPPPSRRASALARRRPTPAARSVSRLPLPARSASSRPTAAARAGASSPSRPPSTRRGRSPAPCRMPRSCCARWRAMTRRTRRPSTALFPITRPPSAAPCAA